MFDEYIYIYIKYIYKYEEREREIERDRGREREKERAEGEIKREYEIRRFRSNNFFSFPGSRGEDAALISRGSRCRLLPLWIPS